MPKIAITGTIASGKSIASEYIRSKGFYVMDLDKVNSTLLDKNSVCYEIIKEHFSEAFDNELNRKKLADIVFNNYKKKKELEDILYPEILKIMLAEMEKHEIFFCEVPLLFESGFDAYFDESWLIVTDEEISIERLIKKGYRKEDAIARINSQMPLEEKKKRADKIIYNKSTFAFFLGEIDKCLEKLC